ncbi:hypothetical protein BKA00_002542 [Actinomadura coerulea]|uniref:Uncharacterized protein n=1 Tax=Actinomadura coerulea TaxID=46159 RepID=A0A7X0KYP5_9ACTN|nr:hypothetical protein [Actinomadura coerulea]MBB6395628.1 hypothetical protein [Actinomadura coerulea]GGQ24985.1 hypothetical protein GCM10010187_46750 [Actinomadura coerulea]
MCFWPQQDFQGQIFVRPRPSGTDTCGNINPAKSAVNLTRETRLLYAFARCDLSNFITQVEPNEARSQIGLDTTAQNHLPLPAPAQGLRARAGPGAR